MKEGWARQQSARFLQASTIQPRLRLIQRFEDFTGLYPWQWTPADGEAFIVHLRSGAKPIQLSTARSYEVVTERVGRMSPRSINEAFVTARQDAGLDEDLDLHCLRHSYITHLTEFGYPARFVQEQVGHTHASTTAIYMGVSDEYRNQLLEASLKRRLGDDWDLK